MVRLEQCQKIATRERPDVQLIDCEQRQTLTIVHAVFSRLGVI